MAKTDNFLEQLAKLGINLTKVKVTTMSSDIFQQVTEELAKELKLGHNPHQQKVYQDWSVLNNQIVGAEDYNLCGT